jgi:ankyrin repeat protein
VPVGDDGETALHVAAVHGRTDVLHALLGHRKFNVNAKDVMGFTALHLAAKHARRETLKGLLSCPKVDINAVDRNGMSALHVAAEQGYADIVKVLLACRGFDADAASRDGSSALHYAVKAGCAEVAKLLLAHRPMDIDGVTRQGETALHVAAFHGRREMVLLLVKMGADVAVTNRSKKTALEVAAIKGHGGIVKLLFQHPVSQIGEAQAEGMRTIGFQLIELIRKNQLKAESFSSDMHKCGAAAAIFYGVDEYVIQNLDTDENREIMGTVFDQLVAAGKANIEQLINGIEGRTAPAYRIGGKKEIARRNGFLLALAGRIGLD